MVHCSVNGAMGGIDGGGMPGGGDGGGGDGGGVGGGLGGRYEQKHCTLPSQMFGLVPLLKLKSLTSAA